MNSRFLLIWAVAATATTLLALGYALGLSSAAPEPTVRLSDASGARVGSTTDNRPPAAASPLPEAFRGLPEQWRSPVVPSRRGYAILFAPERGELIVEQCHHRGYVDAQGRIVEPGWEFCDGVLFGSLELLTADRAEVRDSATGALVEVALAVDNDGQGPVLLLAFAEHSMRLIPGSKNDFLQSLEALAEIRQQRDRYVRTLISREAAARRFAEADVETTGEVPVYALPDAAGDEDDG